MSENVIVSRRSLVAGALIAGAGLVVDSGMNVAFAEDVETQTEPDQGEYVLETAQYGFLEKTANCIACGKCVDACRLYSRTPDDAPARRKLTTYADELGRERTVTTSCMHCEDPACVKVCPAGAIKKIEAGLVVVDKSVCIGCKYCYQACPFDAPHYLSTGMDKCDYCLGNGVHLGEKPYCVQACKCGALFFGKLEDLQEMAGDKAQRIDGPTKPSMLVV